MKYLKGETMNKFLIFLGLSILPMWFISIYFFILPTTDKFLTPTESKNLNTPCILFNYFDTHDMWHFFSAISMFITLLFLWYMDYDIKDLSIDEINQF